MGRKDTPRTVLRSEGTKDTIRDSANLWGAGRARTLQGDWEEVARMPGAGGQERVGIVGAKENDNFTMELASNVTCYREPGPTSPLTGGQ